MELITDKSWRPLILLLMAAKEDHQRETTRSCMGKGQELKEAFQCRLRTWLALEVFTAVS
jgi:hypothetical protein